MSIGEQVVVSLSGIQAAERRAVFLPLDHQLVADVGLGQPLKDRVVGPAEDENGVIHAQDLLIKVACGAYRPDLGCVPTEEHTDKTRHVIADVIFIDMIRLGKAPLRTDTAWKIGDFDRHRAAFQKCRVRYGQTG